MRASVTAAHSAHNAEDLVRLESPQQDILNT